MRLRDFFKRLAANPCWEVIESLFEILLYMENFIQYSHVEWYCCGPISLHISLDYILDIYGFCHWKKLFNGIA